MNLFNLFTKARNELTAIKPVGVEVCVINDNEGNPLRTLMYHIRCPKCGKGYGTDGIPYLNCDCGFNAKINYSKDIPIIGLQNTINHLNIRINYMLANSEQDKVLQFLAEMRELSDALEFGTSYEELKTQKWVDSKLGLKHEIMYSLR